MCLAQGHKVVAPVKLKPATPRSWVKHSIYHWATALPPVTHAVIALFPPFITIVICTHICLCTFKQYGHSFLRFIVFASMIKSSQDKNCICFAAYVKSRHFQGIKIYGRIKITLKKGAIYMFRFWRFRGKIVFALRECMCRNRFWFACMGAQQTLTSIGNNLWPTGPRALIFHMCISLIWERLAKYRKNILHWPWPWPLTYFCKKLQNLTLANCTVLWGHLCVTNTWLVYIHCLDDHCL